MTKQDFLALPTNKQTVNFLYSKADNGFANAPDKFLNEVTDSLRSWLKLPKSVRSITTMPTTESIYNDYLMLQSAGYRKDLILPF